MCLVIGSNLAVMEGYNGLVLNWVVFYGYMIDSIVVAVEAVTTEDVYW